MPSTAIANARLRNEEINGSARVPLPLHEAMDVLGLGHDVPDACETLGRVVVQARVVQDFRPLATSLEWDLGNLHWSLNGLLPFVENQVPYTINNTGELSRKAATVLMANCLEAPAVERIAVLELGAGAGLFARYFLDAFRRLCRECGAPFYDRLTYFVSDRVPLTVEQWRERGIFSEHAGHVVPGDCDALDPASFRPQQGGVADFPSLRAVFCNYVLDSLPAAVIRRGSQGCEELCVRTHLTDDRNRVARYTTLGVDEIRALAASPDPLERARLIPLLPLFELESEFRINGATPPYAEEALSLGGGLDRVVLNYGAWQSLEACLALLDRQGFVMINDYGPVQDDQVVAQSATQRFGSTVALGLNFPLLERRFSSAGWTVVKPPEDEQLPIHPRLILGVGLAKTVDCFREHFSGQAHRRAETPLIEARRHAEAGRLESAMECYKTAVAQQPDDWRLLGEAAEFVTRQLRDYSAAVDLARAALRLNPCYSTWLWNVLGDSLFALDRYDEAHQAFLQAQRADPSDVRTNFNLAYTFAQAGAYREALESIAIALAMDGPGVYRDRLLEKQQHILAAMAAKWTSEQEALNRRAARMR